MDRLRLSKCCCLIDIDIGVMILGSLVWFGLVKEMDNLSIMRAAATLCAGTIFLFMVFDDKPVRRWQFLVAYLIWMVVAIVFDVLQAYEKIEDQHYVELTCKDMDTKG